MSWFQENKFTVIFGGITAVAAGALGWLVLGAKSDLEAAQTKFTDTTSELGRLQNGKPFPNEKNVAAYKAELGRVEGEVSKLHQKLLATEFPLESVAPNAFQDRLKQTIDRIKGEALAQKMMLPGQKKDDASAVAADASFNLGFGNGSVNYLDKLPQDEASSELARELKVIDFVVQLLLTNKATHLVEVKREPMALEKGEKDDKKKEDKKPAPGGDTKPKRDKEDGPKLVTHHKFEVKFIAPQSSVMKILNGITTASQPFIIPRRVFVENEKKEGPVKEIASLAVPPSEPAVPAVPADPASPASPAPVTPDAPAAPVATKEGTKLIWVVGEEHVVVELELEMVDFADAKVALEQKPKTSK